MDKAIAVPDNEDWTWVLRQRCPQCEVNVKEHEAAEIIRLSYHYVESFRDALENSPNASERPVAKVWSLLEYGAHLRDVCEVFRSRIKAMLLHDHPSYPDWDQAQAAVDGAYGESDPVEVADELTTQAGDLLRDVEHLSHEEFKRTGERSDGYVFTVGTLLQYYFHELVHHWWDVAGETFPGN